MKSEEVFETVTPWFLYLSPLLGLVSAVIGVEVSINPYEPPPYLKIARPIGFVSDLSKTSRNLSRMGALAIVYFCVTGILSVVACLKGDQLHPVVKLLFISVPMAMIPLTVLLTKAAIRLNIDPVRYSPSARWLAILLGTFFFPFFTWPAYVVIRNLTYDEEVTNPWRLDMPFIRAYRSRNTYYRGFYSDGDIQARDLPMHPEISVVSSVRLYFQSPAATGAKKD